MTIAKWTVAFVAVYGFGGVLADFVVSAATKMQALFERVGMTPVSCRAQILVTRLFSATNRGRQVDFAGLSC